MRRTVAGLGLATIVAYGTWFYAFGALIDTIADDTGWTVGFLAAVFGAAQLAGAALAIGGGRLLDRFGARSVLLLGGTLGGALIALSPAGGRWTFALAYAIGGAAIEATCFYHITLSAAARIGGERRIRAVTYVTIVGAFAGPVFLPLTARLALAVGWRPTVVSLGITAAAGLTVAALVVPRSVGRAPDADRLPALATVRRALGDAASRRKLLAAPLAATGYGILLVYQVPVMVAAGVPLATAATYGGARALTQLVGRIGLVPVVERTGIGRAYAATLMMGGAGALALAWSGSFVAAAAYVVLAGVAIGAASALDAMYGAEVYDPSGLGTLMGLQQLLAGTAAALGPVVSGFVFDATGSHAFTIGLSVAGFALATLAILGTDRALRGRSEPSGTRSPTTPYTPRR
ncbi:MAG: MFS transporter [Acidimicrobiia bacterium]|nr:MFS transporter [Acidimicrobiia bacterium]